MGTKRTPIGRPPQIRVTPEAVAIFGRGFDIVAAGADRTWEADGGRRREFLDTINALDGELGLMLGERSPLSVHDGLPPSWLPNTLALEGWTTALDLRRALVAALIEQRGHTPALKDEIWRLDRDLKDPVGAEKRMRKQSEDVTEWLERQVQIPEGSHYSRALELLGFQKEVIAQIYDNPGAVPKCAADPEG